jgi:predicted TIM-barrel fold metal-dependent hydrolase
MRSGRVLLVTTAVSFVSVVWLAGQAPAPPTQGAGTPAVGAPGPRQGGAPAGRQGGRGGRGGVQIGPGEECPPGMTEVRQRSCSAPEFPAPSIVDYRPKSTLVSPEHKVPKAKFPAVDVHGHPGNLTTPEALAALVAGMDSIGVQVMLSAENLSGDRLRASLDAIAKSPYKDRFRVLGGVNLGGVGPGWATKAVAQLEADIKAGALGIGEVGKGFGMTTRKADGSRLHIDDPELDPIWQLLAKLGLPAFIHTAEPQEFFEPLDMKNERWLELSLFRDRRNYEPDQVKFETLMTERNNLFRKHPKTKFIAAHFGWHTNDLGRLGKMLDDLPNVTVEMGAVLYDIGRQPRTAYDFFVKYQDRIHFGKDTYNVDEYPYYWRVLETKDDYFDYYRDYHAFWKMYGLGLPDAVLRKVYYQNALRVVPGLPKTGWTR